MTARLSLRSLFAVLLVAPFVAHAGWQQEQILKDIDTANPREIVAELVEFREALNFLNAENLVAPSRVKVQRLVAKVAVYRWQNDDQCDVKDPGTVQPVEMSSCHAEFIHEGRPDKVWVVDVLDSKPDPCSADGTSLPKSSTIRTYSK